MPLIVRFGEFTFYDIWDDCDKVRFTATTSSGTYFCETAHTEGREYRLAKDKFRTEVVDQIQGNICPGWVEIDG